MTGVVGEGERTHPHDGNAVLLTAGLEGGKIRTPLWINQFATDLNLQLDSAQLKTGLSHRPIRLSERFLVFSTLWNVIDRPKYEKLIRTIKEHWARNLNEERPTPMKLTYYGANKTWRGYIEGASIGYAVPDVILTYQFSMRIIPDVADKVSQVVGNDAPYAPTSQDVKNFGDAWYTTAEYRQSLADAIKANADAAKSKTNGSTPKNTSNNPTSPTSPAGTGSGSSKKMQ